MKNNGNVGTLFACSLFHALSPLQSPASATLISRARLKLPPQRSHYAHEIAVVFIIAALVSCRLDAR